jgi:hypothetical protein
MRRRDLSSNQADDAIHLYEAGWSLARIGEHRSVDPTTVLNRLREHGIPSEMPTDGPDLERTGRRCKSESPFLGHVSPLSLRDSSSM